MTLEDHLGDILRKARFHGSIAAEAAAQAAALSPADYAALEETGGPAKGLDYEGLGRLLGLHGAKLKRVAEGWLPEPVDLGTWPGLRVMTTVDDGMGVNCYLVWDEVAHDAALFDTGWSAEPIIQMIEENHLVLRHVFITHSHTDHVAALEDVRKAFPKALLHLGAKSAPPQHRNRANDFVHLGSLRITNRETSGHAEDGTTYIVSNWPEDAPAVAIVGDALFAGSIGRGNPNGALAIQKVREQIFNLPPDTLVCPGHGPLTTVAQEKANNPFFS